ncbi:4039_t:CDS:1, partial [Ambispora leptoticha]
AELQTKLDAAKEPAKKIYQAFKDSGKDDDKKTDEVYTALVKLIEELESTSSWDDKPGE